jgi:shikimate dehydrogenase
LCAVIGDPVRHSLSPLLHNTAYQALGLDLVYLAFSVREGEAAPALAGAAALGFVGLSVTTPHKDAIARAADQMSPTVERLGAANSVRFLQGLSIAESTDGPGLLDDLDHSLGFEAAGSHCAVIGAGGAARGVILALAEAGAAEILVINRSRGRAESAVELAGDAGRVAEEAELATAELVVNATSIGLSNDPNAAAVGTRLGARCHGGQLAVDLVYHPARSAFLAGAADAGATVRNGLGMLVHQAARQVQLFTDELAPLDEMWAAVAERPTS